MSILKKSEGKLPFNVLQIGCGSFGTHLKTHLSSKFDKFSLVLDSKAEKPNFQIFDYIFLAVNDSSLQSLVKEISTKTSSVKIVHFSGFNYFEKTLGLHPVASFNTESDYNLDEITFVADGKLDDILKLTFPRRDVIDPLKKKDYHNFLSVSANALQLLVNNISTDFKSSLDMNPQLLKQIVLQSLAAESAKGENSFSGPWIRGEKSMQDKTVESMQSKSLKNLNALFKKEIEIYKNRKGGKL